MITKNRRLLLTVMLIIECITLSSCQSKAESKGAETDTMPHIKVIEKIDTTINIKNMEYPTVTNTFETFDFETYEQRPPADANGWRDDIYIQKTYNGMVIWLEKSSNEYYCEIYYPESSFRILKIYYANGNIKEKGLTYVQGFEKGIWHEFDQLGKLVKDVNYDKPFTFTFEDVAKFCAQNGISLAKGYKSSIETSIYRKSYNSGCYWEIESITKDIKNPPYNLDMYIKLDGKTGKILSRTQESFTYRR